MKRLIVHRNIALLATISMVVLSLFMLNMARANSWSWTTGIPTTVYSDEVSPNDDWNNSCASKFHNIRDQRKIEGVEDQSRQYNTECLIGSGDNYQLFEGNDGKLAVSFAGESNAHVINSGASCFYGCVYMPSRDYLISIQSPGTFGDGKLVIFKDFVKRLHMQRITLPNLRVETYFTGEQSPDEILTDRFITEDFSTTTKHLQRSQNDKWLVFELVGRGMYRIDMDTGNTTKFLYLTTKYWDPGTAPSMQIDVSNDGRHVAIFGRNTSNAIYELTPDCGFTVPSDPAQIKALERQGQPTTECPTLYLAAPMNDPANNSYMPNLTTAYEPKFSDDGGEISFYANDSSSPVHHVNLRAANYTGPQPLDYLALGDSYSSGEGDIDPYGVNYYRQHTDVEGDKSKGIPKEKCHVSTRSYPYLLAAHMGLTISGPKQWDTVTCSGATTHDINPDHPDTYKGQGDRLKDFSYSALQSQALNEFIPGRKQQIEFVRTYKPKVITLTIGGNNVDFINKLYPCATSLTTCDYVNSARTILASDIRNQYDNLRTLYKNLLKESDNSRIYVISYPNFINDSPSATCRADIAFLNSDEREMISNSITFLNNVIKQAASAEGVHYVDIEHSLDGHRICDSGDIYENSAVFRIGTLGFSDYGSFHPNAMGQKAIADIIWEAISKKEPCLINISACSNNARIEPISSSTKDNIEIPNYFGNIEWKNSFYKQFSTFDHIINGTVDITVGSYAFASNSIATIFGHSEPVNLGQYIAAPDGSLRVSIKLPDAMKAGFHRLEIQGISYSGELVTYEQTILLKDAAVSANDEGKHASNNFVRGARQTFKDCTGYHNILSCPTFANETVTTNSLPLTQKMSTPSNPSLINIRTPVQSSPSPYITIAIGVIVGFLIVLLRKYR